MSSPNEAIGGRYRLEELLGGGSGAEVWRAQDLELGRTVAVKLLAPTADPERFRREAQSVASLAHENVMQLFDYGSVDERPYMVLEYLPGGTLQERLVPGEALPAESVQQLASGVAAGLAHAHARGIVHRDLKPANILFGEAGHPKIADFGIARRAAGEGTLTEAGTVLGTANYISPEQAMGKPAGPASDVYALGVILFQLLTGHLPFEAGDALTLAELHRDAPPPPVAPVAEDVPPALVALTGRALAKDPAERPADGAAMLAALAAIATSATETNATRVLPAVAPHRRRGRTALAAALLALLALAGAGLAWTVTRTGGSGPTLVGSAAAATHKSSTTLTSATGTAETTAATTAQVVAGSTSSASTTTPATTQRHTTTSRTPPPPAAATTTTVISTTTATTAPTTTAVTTTATTPTTTGP